MFDSGFPKIHKEPSWNTEKETIMTDSNTSSNASNFGEFISSGVDPRTGTYSASVYLGKFIGHRSSGPTFDLSLNFTPGSTLDFGFGRGWSLPTGFFNSKTKPYERLALPGGQSFHLSYDFGTEKYSMPYRKLLDVDILFDQESEELIVVTKDATRLVYDFEDGYLKRKINSQGLAIEFEFELYNQQRVLAKITDSLEREVIFDYFTNKYEVTVEHKFLGVVHQRFIIDKDGGVSGYRLKNVTQKDNGDAALNSFAVEYQQDEFLDADLISKVTYPSGMTEELSYADYHLTPPGYPVEKIRRVSSFKRTNLGLNQPDSVTEYTYSQNAYNYLGNGSGMRYEQGKDTLFYVTSNYIYESTEIINGAKSVSRQYNKYHLLELAKYLENGNLYRQEDYEYFADLEKGIEEQTAKYSLVKSQTTTHYYNDNSRAFTLEYDYDDYANPLLEQQADGSQVVRTFYPSGGEGNACPPDPNGMVSFVKTETFVPATADPERTTTMTYKNLTRLDDSAQNFVVLASQTDANQSVELEYHQDNSNIYSYGRIASQLHSIDGNPSTTSYQYEFLEKGLRTTNSVLSHDELEMSESEQVDYLFGLPIEYIDPDDNVSRFVYDKLGRLTQEIVAPETEYEAVTIYTYQVGSGQNLTTETDSSGNTLVTHLNNAGKAVRIELQGRDDMAPKTIQECDYDEFGLMVSQTDTDWLDEQDVTLTTKYEYDINGEVKKVIHQDGRIEHIDQDPVNLTTVHEQQGLLSETNVYDVSGLVQRKETRDSGGNLIAKTDYQYDGYGNLRYITDTEERETEQRYDSFDRLTDTVRHIDGQAVTESLSYPSFTFEAIPDTVSVNEVEQGSRVFDGLLRLKSKTVNDGTTSYNYEGVSGLPNRITTAKQDVLNITNNIYLQAPESVSCSADARLNCTCQYDSVTGLSTADSNQECQESVIYDSFGRVITESVKLADGTLREANFRYSLLGKMLEKTDFFGNTTLYSYDDLGRLQTITETVSETQTTTAIKYDGFSRPYKYTTERGLDSAEIELGFNDVGLETSRVARFNGTQEFSIAQNFNIRQQLETRTFTDAQGQTVETFTYDDFARLDSYLCTGMNAPVDEYGNTLTGQSFVYDIYGNVKKITSTFDSGSNNITTFSYSSSNLQRLESLTNTHSDYPVEVTFRYDAAGNLLNDEQGREYEYNALNQLSSVASSDEAQMSQYTYDAQGKVVSQTVAENLLYFFYLADQLSNELCDDEHSVLHRIAPGLFARTVKGTEDQLHQFMLGNSQDSVIETLSTNEAIDRAVQSFGQRLYRSIQSFWISIAEALQISGHKASLSPKTQKTLSRDKETRRYTPYGEGQSISEIGANNATEGANGQSILYANPFGFNGQRQDPVTKLYPLGNGYRAYSPVLKRFCAHDSASPFGAGGINVYAYCSGDPINRRDPSGHFGLIGLLIGAIVGAVVGAGLSAAAEGIKVAINPEHKFDWKQVGIGAALGFITGGFGAAAQGAKTSVKVGLAVADTVVSSGADFGLSVATGTPVNQAGINAGIGAVIGLVTFGAGGSAASVKNKKQVPRVKLGLKGMSSEWVDGGKFYRGYTDNFMGTGKEAIGMHALTDDKRLLITGEKAVEKLEWRGFMVRVVKEVDFAPSEKLYGHQLPDYMRRKHGIDLSARRDTIHLLSCFAKRYAAQDLANETRRPVIGYSKHGVWTNSLEDIEKNDFVIRAAFGKFDPRRLFKKTHKTKPRRFEPQ